MHILVLDNAADGGVLVRMIAEAFEATGSEVARADLKGVVAEASAGESLVVTSDPAVRALMGEFAGKDLVVYVTDAVTFADGGGPYLRQASTWAERHGVPVIAIALVVDVSTRELRAIGVEAAYQVRTPEDAQKVVHTWTW